MSRIRPGAYPTILEALAAAIDDFSKESMTAYDDDSTTATADTATVESGKDHDIATNSNINSETATSGEPDMTSKITLTGDDFESRFKQLTFLLARGLAAEQLASSKDQEHASTNAGVIADRIARQILEEDEAAKQGAFAAKNSPGVDDKGANSSGGKRIGWWQWLKQYLHGFLNATTILKSETKLSELQARIVSLQVESAQHEILLAAWRAKSLRSLAEETILREKKAELRTATAELKATLAEQRTRIAEWKVDMAEEAAQAAEQKVTDAEVFAKLAEKRENAAHERADTAEQRAEEAERQAQAKFRARWVHLSSGMY